MQENREFLADLEIALALQLFRSRAHDDPVPLAYRQAEQAIPNRATDQVHLHPPMVPETHRGLRAAVARIVLLLVVTAMLPACGTMYVTQAARGQWQVMRAREPIDKVIASQSTPQDLRARLTEVRAAREFASRELGLPDNGSYRSYADLKRPYVVWNVVATPEFSVHPQRWCFPIAGCVAYRGYFAEEKARKFSDSLSGKGFDTFVGGVPAYSTLGKFQDPVLNTMLGYGDDELAAIIFHELSHQLVYVAGDSEFNEAFATAVEQAGLERWLRFRGRESDLGRYKSRRVRQAQVVGLFARARTELADLYEQKLPSDSMRARKREILASLDGELAVLEKKLGIRSAYRDLAPKGLNNAILASVATYYDCVPGFERLLAGNGGDLPKFYAAVRELTRTTRAERHELLCRGETANPPTDNRSNDPGLPGDTKGVGPRDAPPSTE
jgi:predicted aminopeptidase